MTRVRRSVVANFLGQGWSALLGFVLLPIYLRLMGVEAFGLTAFYQTLIVTLNVFDFGFSTTINRQLARSSARPDAGDDARDLVRTMEAAYWCIGVALGAAVLLASPMIA